MSHRMLALSALVAIAAVGRLDAADAPKARTFEKLVSVTAKVEAIDPAKRELTLRGPLGNAETVVVGDEVKRFDEIKVGDEVTAKYYIGIAAELRAPTEEEKKQPYLVLDDTAKRPKSQTPGAGVARTVRVIATIEGLDRPTQTVTLKGPRGRYITVRVEDPAALLKPHIGDTVIVTTVEALAVSVDKVEPK